MKKSLLYILIHFSSAVIANWITVEHDFKMCDQVVPSSRAAFHINDDGITYSTSLLVRQVKIIRHEPPLTTLNITMWGCTYDCNFSFMVKLNRDDLSVSTYTVNNINNYKCNFNNYTIKLIPTPKITYLGDKPDSNYVFPPHLTAKYCSEGKHPDQPDFAINATEHIAECIDYLTGNEVGTYAASLQFGSGSSFNHEDYPVATYHMIDSANKLFNYWERHHRGYHDALTELSVKMTPDNLKQLIPPPPPPPKKNLLLEILVPLAVFIVIIAIPIAAEFLTPGAVVADEIATTIAETSELGAEMGAADDSIAATAEGSVARNAAVGWRNEAESSNAARKAEKAAQVYNKIKKFAGGCSEDVCRYTNSLDRMASYYSDTENPNLAQMLAALNRVHRLPPPQKRDTSTMDNIGAFTASLVNMYFLPSLMDNVHQSFTGSGQTYPDISSYLSAASENLQFHFEETLHNNFFTANKSILASFTISQGINYDQLLESDDDVYYFIKNGTYNFLAASIISTTLQLFNVDICDPRPSFCGQSCDNGHIYCPTIGDDKCTIAASDGQINELKFLRDTFDICSTNTTQTGWNITHNKNCDIKQFQCQ